MISKWKTEALKSIVEIFSGKQAKKDKNSEKDKDELHQKIGKAEVENNFLKKSIEPRIYPTKKFGR